MGADARAKSGLRASFPIIGPWTSAALWHGCGPIAPVPESPLTAELDEIVEQRLAGLLLRYVRDAGVELDTEIRGQLNDASFLWMSITSSAASSGAVALTRLRDAGIDGVLSKGPGIAAAYPGLTYRPYSDLDIVVRPDQFERAVALLEDQGWIEEERNRQPWNYFRRWCREGVNLRQGEGSVDIHHRFPPWIWTGPLSSTAMGERIAVSVGGVDLPCLPAADNLVVAALHLISDRNAPGRSLLVWRDVVQLASAIPVADAVRAAGARQLAGWLRAVLLAMPERVRPRELAAALPDDPIPHARRLALLLSARTAGLGVMASQFLRLPLPNGLAFLVGMLLPSRRFLRRKFPQTEHRYRYWWSYARRHGTA